VALYNGGYVNDSSIDVYSPSESDSTKTDDQLVPVSSHLSPAYGSDVFTPFFTNIFPQMSPTSTLTEVTLNIEELNVRGGSPEDFPFTRLLVESASPPTNQSPLFTAEEVKQDPFQTFEVDRGAGRLRPVSPDPTPAELQHYCKCRQVQTPVPIFFDSETDHHRSAYFFYDFLDSNSNCPLANLSGGEKIAPLAQCYASVRGIVRWNETCNQFHFNDACLCSGDACA
jgi:hypothetical protein